MGNNLFNQKYFLVLWCWWTMLLALSVLMIIYRLARISIPRFSRAMLMRYVHGKQLREVRNLEAADYFVLELMIQNLEDVMTDQVLDEIEKRVNDSSELNDSNPSVMIVDTMPLNKSGMTVDTMPQNFYKRMDIPNGIHIPSHK